MRREIKKHVLTGAQAYISISTPVGDLTAADEDEDDSEHTAATTEEEEEIETLSDSMSEDNDSDSDDYDSDGSENSDRDDTDSVLSDDRSTSSTEDQASNADATSLLSDQDEEETDSEAFSNDTVSAADDAPSIKEELHSFRAVFDDASLSAREIITLYALSRALRFGNGQSASRSAVILVHLVALRHCKISQRSFAASNLLGRQHDAFMQTFSSIASCALSGWFEGDYCAASWDAYDLFDGRLYLQIYRGYADLRLPEPLHKEFTRLAEILTSLSGIDVSGHLPETCAGGKAGKDLGVKGKRRSKPQDPSQLSSSVLPFTHPIMDQHLEPVKVKTADVSELPTAPKIFLELTHWHNAKKPLDPKFIPKPPGFFRMKRNQKFMADTIAYSASLSGSSGKIIDPEIIVAQSQVQGKKAKAQEPSNSGQDWKVALREKEAAKTKKPAGTKKQPAKSGKQKALEATEALRTKKTEDKSAAVVSFWANRCGEFEKETSLAKRYAKAWRYFQEVSSTSLTAEAVGSEVSLYLCHVLTLLRKSKDESNRSGK